MAWRAASEFRSCRIWHSWVAGCFIGRACYCGRDGENVSAASVKPMEKRKNRKALDKERHGVASKSVQIGSELKDTDDAKEQPASSPSSGLPEFHITVFKDLVSINASVREVAVETRVMELQEVQKVNDKLGKEELVERGL